jgi:glucan phosphoethanolaminetransferase (alkaline phosphatase superfamily)
MRKRWADLKLVTMKKFEKIIGFILLIGLVLKYFLISTGFGALLIASSLMILAYYYFFFGFAFFNQIQLKRIFKKESYSEISTIKIIIALGLGIGLSCTCIGILFKIQYWTGARQYLIIGIAIILIVLLIGVISLNKIKGSFLIGILKRSILIGGFGALLLLISDYSIIKVQYRNHPLYIKAYQDLKSDPENPDFKKNYIKEKDRVSLPKEVFRYKYNEEK